MRQNAANWLELADKIHHFRRDQLTGKQAGELQQKRAELRLRLKERADAGKLKLGIEALEGVLRQTGGTFYPKSAMAENVEFFLVAAIIILGLRAYFIQPFKIPTNSMWPSYYGMTAEVLPLENGKQPGFVARLFRFVAFGASRREVTAPASGEVSLKFFSGSQAAYTVKRGRKWLMVPARVKEYTFSVGGAEAKVQVPYDFHDFDRVMQETFFGGPEGLGRHMESIGRNGGARRSVIELNDGAGDVAPAYTVKLGKTVRTGETILRFDILTGDQLFVDRISYHFVRPRVGSGFVFRTGNIPGIERTFGDQYYIKRLVGVPGDLLEIREPGLYRNGAPITGAAAFDKNARREGLYRGYANIDGGSYLRKGEVTTAPSRMYMALGDNSYNSADGRYWGFVPQKDVVGRPIFIYYPFTRRWGPAR